MLLISIQNSREKVIAALGRIRRCYPRRQAMHSTVAYFREHRHRLGYAHLRAQNLPSGSGVVDAACKTVVSQRLKQSGKRWQVPGGQAILMFRAWYQSESFKRAWALLAKMYQQTVTLPRKVIALSKHKS